ncbi:MAG TPA: hypothetical protein VKV04_03315 [Verrucomicrobiae bacterium]|nr:hypothetical protein [Verrucomicrobiae bacterium]
MKDDSKYRAFAASLHVVRDKILLLLEQNQPLKIAAQMPKTWYESKQRIAKVAEELMLCPDVDKFVESLKTDLSIALVLVELMTETDDMFLIQMIQNAFENSPSASEILPGQAFAMFLIEICKQPFLRLSAD